MKRSLLILSLFLLSSLHLQGAKRPAWVDSIPNKPTLYQGIGVADATGSKAEDRKRADQNARTEIIQEISSTITSEVTSFYSESSTNGTTNDAQNTDVFTSLSSAYAEATIEGIKIVDRYYDKRTKVHYSYATLERAAFQTQMALKAEEARTQARERFRYSQESLTAGNIAGALDQLSQALSHVMLAQSIVKKQLRGDLTGDGSQEYLDAALTKELGKLTRDINIIKESGDAQQGERNQGLAEALMGQVIYVGDGNLLPVVNLPLTLAVEGAEADYVPLMNTDADGRFSARIFTVHSASVSDPSVRINLYLPHMKIWADHAGEGSAAFLPPGVTYAFKMDVAASVRVFVRVLEEINGVSVARSKSDGILIKALLGKKYKVIDARQVASKISAEELDQFVGYEAFDSLTESLREAADYAIVGLVFSETSSTGTLNYARATATLNAIDLSSGRIIATGQLENIKAAGNTEQKANTSAIRKCSNNAIGELLSQLDKALN